MRWPRITIGTPMLAPPVRIQTRLKRQIRAAVLRDDRGRMIFKKLRRHLLRRLSRIILQTQRRKPLVRIEPRPTPPNTRRPFRRMKPKRRIPPRLGHITSRHGRPYARPQFRATTCSPEHHSNRVQGLATLFSLYAPHLPSQHRPKGAADPAQGEPSLSEATLGKGGAGAGGANPTLPSHTALASSVYPPRLLRIARDSTQAATSAMPAGTPAGLFRRAMNSSASARYAIAPRPEGSYSMMLFPKLGASPSRTVRGMIVW